MGYGCVVAGLHAPGGMATQMHRSIWGKICKQTSKSQQVHLLIVSMILMMNLVLLLLITLRRRKVQEVKRGEAKTGMALLDLMLVSHQELLLALIISTKSPFIMMIMTMIHCILIRWSLVISTHKYLMKDK